MKKILSFVLAVVCLLSLCGCTAWAEEEPAALEQLQSEKDETELWALAEEAYIFSYPLVLMEMTARTLPANECGYVLHADHAEY